MSAQHTSGLCLDRKFTRSEPARQKVVDIAGYEVAYCESAEVAQLFAAAPELLEALTGLLRQTANPDPLHPAWREARAKAANAIAKAGGQ
jgi:hypothetical protein